MQIVHLVCGGRLRPETSTFTGTTQTNLRGLRTRELRPTLVFAIPNARAFFCFRNSYEVVLNYHIIVFCRNSDLIEFEITQFSDV